MWDSSACVHREKVQPQKPEAKNMETAMVVPLPFPKELEDGEFLRMGPRGPGSLRKWEY